MIVDIFEEDNIKVVYDNTFNFFERFNFDDGDYFRSGVWEKNEYGKPAKETDKDPFMRSLMNLIDIGVAGSCKNGQLGICLKSGVQCYQSGNTVFQPDMTKEDYANIINQVSGKVFQVALGGRGDPNLCDNFEFYCEYALENDIVPNYTTSGINLSDKQIEITKKFVGACAVSWYRNKHTLDAIQRFVNAGITTNIHYVLGNNSIDEAIERLRMESFPDGVNAVIFLLHKPVGLGQQRNVLQHDNPKVKSFFDVVNQWNGTFKIGFDSCSIPGIINFTDKIAMDSIDTCEGARFSAYITPDMVMTPCSFDQELKYGISLREYTIEEAWNSDRFNEFRDRLQNRCVGCSLHTHCKSGCPLKPEIVLCNKKEKAL